MEHQLIRAFTDAGPVGQGVMLILGVLSTVTWAIIIEKIFFFRKLKRDAQSFLSYFHTTGESVIGSLSLEKYENDSLLYKLYVAGVKELRQMLKTGKISANRQITTSQQDEFVLSFKRVVSSNIQILERNMAILAASSNVSPLLGLLGTVYGLLISFNDMGRMGSASIEVVGPGISEALITTVIGLFVAIPSSVGYNFLYNVIKNLVSDMENFASEFLSLIEKGQFE